MQENYPILVSVKQLKSEFHQFQKIPITSNEFAVGRSLDNTVVIPYIAISRKHCLFKKINDGLWLIEDFSAFGIQVNSTKLRKSQTHKLTNNDIIQLDATGEFIYKFVEIKDDDFESPRKRIKLDPDYGADILNNVKMKFEESQSYEIKHIEEKILNTKHMQTANLLLKQQLEDDMACKIKDLESHYALQIENLNGEKNEVERQKALLEKERDNQLNVVKNEMESRISELMNQIQKHNETEAELVTENAELKKKLLKEREDFLEELNRENTSKQELLHQLEAKIKEQEDIRAKEKIEMENLRLAKEKELKELEEQKNLRELELEQELGELKRNLEELAEKTASEKEKAEQDMKEKLEEMKKLSDEEKIKMEQLLQERAEAEKRLSEAQRVAEKSLEDARNQVKERETQLAALAAERIERQAEQSGQVINSLQEQLEKVKSQLQSVETEKNTLLENICFTNELGESSKEATLTEFGNLMESELQCSICAELFVQATTLNCAHTYCKYCITMWKKKKKECPICRSPITSECKSLVLDSFIDKMVQSLTDEMKRKRLEMLKDREELEKSMGQTSGQNGRRESFGSTGSYGEGGGDYLSDEQSLEEEEELYDEYDYDYHRRRHYYEESDEDEFDEFGNLRDSDEDVYEDGAGSGTDAGSGAGSGTGAASGPDGDAAASTERGTDSSNEATGASSSSSNRSGRRRAGNGTGAYYGGYGRCFRCGERGHWAPGCPLR